MPQKQTTENSNAFKNWINAEVVERMAKALQSAQSDFDARQFCKISNELGPLELKARVRLISATLYQHLPKSFPQAIDVLLESLKKKNLKSFDLWPYTEFIQTYGLEHRQKSLDALYHLTQLFTAEFAVRPFLKNHTSESIKYLLACAKDDNVHVRRWSTEGSRPRLPWGERLDLFIKNPTLTLPILELLKYDEELYVRKSVANHLNDIAKDHPGVVIKTLKAWQKEAPNAHQEKIKWITRHALRTLIKKGNSEALQLMGVAKTTAIKISQLELSKKTYKVGEFLQFNFSIQSKSPKKQKLIIDYVIHHQKAAGKTTPKVFKLKTVDLHPNQKLLLTKNHSLKPITTRKYYKGTHTLEIQINGKPYTKKDWHLRTQQD